MSTKNLFTLQTSRSPAMFSQNFRYTPNNVY